MNFPSHVKVYIVGGYVRDRLLGRECQDHDFVVVGATPQEMVDLGFRQVGADFPVFLHPISGDEFALARIERKVGVGYHGFETDFGTGVTLEDDLMRRDLTINAMAREVIGWNELGHARLSDDIIDPFGGQQDLRDGVLCHTSAAFSEDPLRVLRVARFRARFGFNIAAGTFAMMETLVRTGETDTLTPERVWTEIEKAMTEPQPELFFDTLNSLVANGQFFKGLDTTHFVGDAWGVDHRFMALLRDAPIGLLIDLKAPGDLIRRARKIRIINNAKLETAEDVMALLKDIDALRNEEDFGLITVDLFRQGKFTLATELERALAAMQEVKFVDLPESVRNGPGKQIGEAMEQARLNAIKAVGVPRHLL